MTLALNLDPETLAHLEERHGRAVFPTFPPTRWRS